MTAPWASGLAATGKMPVRQAIAQAAERTGVDFGYLLAQAKTESGLNPNARARTSSAAGLYQFIDQSWLGVLKQHGADHGYGWAADAIERRGGRYTVAPSARAQVFALRNDPEAAALMAGEFANDNAAGLEKGLGRPPTKTDLYFAHFLGLQGAVRFLRAADAYPDSAASTVFPREAGANRTIFFRKSGEARSLAQVYQLMGRKLEQSPGDGRMDERVRYAAATPSSAPKAAAQSPDPAPASKPATSDTMLALGQQRQRFNVLRPDPQSAMLAYMMVSSPMDLDRGSGNG